MSDADFRILPPIQVTGEGSFSRPSPATYWDKDGVLRTAEPNAFRATYDPADLSKAPYPLIEPEATNYIRNNTMAGAAIGSPGSMPSYWEPATNIPGCLWQVVGLGQEDGIDYVDIRVYGTVGSIVRPEYTFQFDTSTGIPASQGQVWGGSVFARLVSGTVDVVQEFEHYIIGYKAAGGISEALPIRTPPKSTPLGESRFSYRQTLTNKDTAYVVNRIDLNFRDGGGYDIDVVVRIGLPQLERDRVTSPIQTSGATATRAADVVGSAVGLLHSNVPEPEPLWVAGSYAKGARVRDATHVVWESLVADNAAPLPTATDTKWGKVGATNRYKMFDKTVNSRTVAPEQVAFTLVKPGVTNTMMLLNLAGASVTIAQADSGYSKTKSLIRHEVLSWYDWFYQEPVRAGDAVFEDIPPFPGMPITVTVNNPGAEAGVGAVLFGKAITVGQTQWELTAGVLSYSTSTTDSEGSITMRKRPNARRMNFEVAIPRGFETEAYRILTDYTDVEIGIIAAKQYEMTYAYGFLGQWEVPISIKGKKVSIEFRGLT